MKLQVAANHSILSDRELLFIAQWCKQKQQVAGILTNIVIWCSWMKYINCA